MRRTATLIFLTLLASCAKSAASTYLGDDRPSAFDASVAAIERVERISQDDFTRLGTSLDAGLAQSRQRFVEAATAGDVYYAFVSLKNSFHDAHSSFFPDSAWNLKAIPSTIVPSESGSVLPISVRAEYDDSGARYYHIEGAGIAANSSIATVDSVPIAQIEQQWLEWYPAASTEGLGEFVAQSLSYQNPQVMPAAKPGTATTLGLNDSQGHASNSKFVWQAAPASSAAPSSCCATFHTAEARSDYSARTPTSTGENYCTYASADPTMNIVRYCSFAYASEQAQLTDETSLVAYLRNNGVNRVLIDVRENGGGNFEPSFFGNFTSAPYKIATTQLYFAPTLVATPALIANVLFVEPSWVAALEAAAPAAGYSQAMPFVCRTSDCAVADVNYAAGSAPPLHAIILTGPSCYSSCDEFVSIMSDNGIAKLTGMPPAAADSPLRYWATLSLANGDSFNLTLTVGVSDRPNTANIVLEGHPPTVDFPVRPTANNRGQYLNDVLNSVGW